jgi:GT2 family glycosyltransferase
MMIDLSFVILTWNSNDYLARCLDSFISECREENISWEIIIVDNGSTDGTCELVERYRGDFNDQMYLFALKENLGTTYPRNLGLKKAKGNNCCILDSDTEFHSGSIRDVLNLLNNENIGMIAPKLLLPGNIIQNSVKKFPTFLDKLSKIPGIIFNKKVSQNDFYEAFPFQESRPVDTAISACWFFKKSLLEKVGFLDETIFYSPEDVEYCLRVNKSGLQVIYFPSVSILHHTQQISHHKPFSKLSRSHFSGLLYYFKKHGGWSQRPTFSHVPK